jgi:hypothetical protein
MDFAWADPRSKGRDAQQGREANDIAKALPAKTSRSVSVLLRVDQFSSRLLRAGLVAIDIPAAQSAVPASSQRRAELRVLNGGYLRRSGTACFPAIGPSRCARPARSCDNSSPTPVKRPCGALRALAQAERVAMGSCHATD